MICEIGGSRWLDSDSIYLCARVSRCKWQVCCSDTGVCEIQAFGPCKFIGFGGIDVTNHVNLNVLVTSMPPNLMNLKGPAVFISQAPVAEMVSTAQEYRVAVTMPPITSERLARCAADTSRRVW